MLSTKQKIKIARIFFSLLFFFRRMLKLPLEVTVKRNKINWNLNLKEGIDFAIYLLGGFEVRTIRQYKRLIKDGDVVLDIGANIGAHTLPFAQLVGASGKVIAFEPTSYAFNKLKMNLSINPELAARCKAYQMMLVSNAADVLPEAIYSSWPLEKAEDLHNDHLGRLMTTRGAQTSTLDNFLDEQKIDKVDFIKLDVDGNELDVLLGAKDIIEKSKPKIMLELAPYVHDDNSNRFSELLTTIWSMGYVFYNAVTGVLLPNDIATLTLLIPQKGALNVMGVYKGAVC